MKTATTAAIAAAILVASCAVFEDRFALLTTPEFASATIDAGCEGGQDFLDTASANFDSPAVEIIAKGVEIACAIRAGRSPISATVYDVPLDAFCAQARPLQQSESDAPTRTAFNAEYAKICEGRL